MTTIEHETETSEDPKAPETGLLHRSFASAMSAGDGRTIDVRIVPYGERITHHDGHGGVPKGVPYQEEWVAGAFAGQTNAANRVLLKFEHSERLGDVIGHGTALIERDDGLYGSFRLHENPDGDKALMLVKEGVLTGISVEAFGRKSIRSADGVIRRVKAHLHGAALCRKPAFSGSVVLTLREAAIIDEELVPLDPDPELIARCRRLGIRMPQRYEAHPDETDTPAETGTSEDGTRQTDANHTSSEET